ncbi:putative Glutamate receptor-like 84, partial [Homarus americanus]
RGLCRLAITRGGFMAVQYSMAFPLNSSLRPVVDQLIYHMGEFGLLDKYLRADISNTTHCLQPPGREDYRSDRKLAIGDFLGVFSLYAAGEVMRSYLKMVGSRRKVIKFGIREDGHGFGVKEKGHELGDREEGHEFW